MKFAVVDNHDDSNNHDYDHADDDIELMVVDGHCV